MSSMNRVFLMGNLTRDPELRHTPSGAAVADLGVAVNENYRNKAGQDVKATCFVDVVVWNRQAETCAQYLGKGSAVMVEGKLQQDHWETPEGQKRYKTRVRANRVQFLSYGRKNGDGPAAPALAAARVQEVKEETEEPGENAEHGEEKLPF